MKTVNGYIMEYLEWFQHECYPTQTELYNRNYDRMNLRSTLRNKVKERAAFHHIVKEKLRELWIKENKETGIALEEEVKDPNYEPPLTGAVSESEPEKELEKKRVGRDDTSVKRIREKGKEDLQIEDNREQLEQDKEEEDADLVKGKRKKETMGRKAVSSVKRRRRRTAAQSSQSTGNDSKPSPQSSVFLSRPSSPAAEPAIPATRLAFPPTLFDQLVQWEAAEVTRQLQPTSFLPAVQESQVPSPAPTENREDDDDSGEQYTLQERYFTSARPTTDRHR
ncbi:unnamed protein product [Porites evermanni]|uniref:Uncharacterized protein n=1 Tax=Porites evermanni TaxID=104178 RepID=A0ABN8MMS6_9CNID|nr:unnamed protein product [Porites evermanni]